MEPSCYVRMYCCCTSVCPHDDLIQVLLYYYKINIQFTMFFIILGIKKLFKFMCFYGAINV